MIRKRIKPVFLTGFFWVLLLRITAQIELPEFTEPSEGNENRAEDRPEVENSTEPETQRLIQQLNQTKYTPWQAGNKSEEPSELRRIKIQQAKYEEAPDRLILQVELVRGGSIWGEVNNFSFRVENRLGSFPVLLNEIEGMTRSDKNDKIFTLTFRNGDQLTGSPRLDPLPLEMAEGGIRHIVFEKIQWLQVSQAKP